jgi:hypothetical protein
MKGLAGKIVLPLNVASFHTRKWDPVTSTLPASAKGQLTFDQDAPVTVIGDVTLSPDLHSAAPLT